MHDTIKTIALSDDISVIRVAEFFYNQLTMATNNSSISKNELFSLASSIDGFVDIDNVLKLHSDTYLSTAHSIEMVRRLLVVAAGIDQKLANFIEHCFKNWPDERQTVGNRVSVGLIAALLLLLATTDIEYKDGSISIHKRSIALDNIDFRLAMRSLKVDLLVRPSPTDGMTDNGKKGE